MELALVATDRNTSSRVGCFTGTYNAAVLRWNESFDDTLHATSCNLERRHTKGATEMF